MELLYKKDFERAQKYWDAFWCHEIIDRPVVCVGAPLSPDRPVFSDGCAASFRALTGGKMMDYYAGFDARAAKTYYGGELMPYLNVGLGPDQFAGFLGAEIASSDGHDTTWSIHCVEDWDDYDLCLHTGPDSYFELIKTALEKGAEFSEGRFLIGMFDLHSNLDAMSALRGPQNFCYDFVDCPEAIERAHEKVRSFYRPIYEMIYVSADMERRGCVGWSPAYCQGRQAVIQCDFLALIGPEDSRRHLIPAIIEEASYLDRCVYHFDGVDALRHMDDILAIEEIDCIQWVPGDGKPRTVEWMDLLKKIQAAGKSLWLYDWTIDEIKRYHKELKPELCLFQVGAATPGDADALLEHLVKNT